MPESRDRLIRENPSTPIFGRRSSDGILQNCESESSYLNSIRFSNGSGSGSGSGRNLFGSPLQSTTRMVSGSPTMRLLEISESSRRISVRRGNRNLYRSSFAESSNRRHRRGNFMNNSPLPGWYPRTPLRDITGVVNAIERRRTRLRQFGHHRLGEPSPHESTSATDSNPSTTDAPLEQEITVTTPAAVKGCPPLVNHLLNIRIPNYASEESSLLTPQKKLLNSIDQVEKVIMEEFRRMKRTPSAKKAEREKKIRRLMAMR